MKKATVTIASFAVLCSIQALSGQTSPAPSASSPAAAAAPVPRSEVYSITFIHGAPGKASAIEANRKTQAAAAAANAGHSVLLRHQSGSPWDYVAITHLGPKATVDPAGNPNGAAMKPLMDWHDDTFVNGSAWAEFAKQMDLDDSGKPKSATSVYVVSVYRPLVGQEDALDKFLNEPPKADDPTAGSVVFQHLEGGAWRFCSISRYKSYAEYAAGEAKAVTDTAKGNGQWFQLRNLVSFHNDTVAAAVQ